MILIADSGSTKTDWCLANNGTVVARHATQGINPFFQNDEEIRLILNRLVVEDLPKQQIGQLTAIYFYGAGIRPEMQQRMRDNIFAVTGVENVDVQGDLIGAARSLFGHDSGIACILGTGSNSGLYDGKEVVKNTPPLGFILGDEGSGAVLGKLFLGALCKGLMPDGMLDEWVEATGQNVADIIQHVYRQPLPNRYLAQATHFMHSHLDVEEVRQLVITSFRDFFRRNLVQYGHSDLPVRAIGSIAYHFHAQLSEAAEAEGFMLDRVEQSPMMGLVDYHK